MTEIESELNDALSEAREELEQSDPSPAMIAQKVAEDRVHLYSNNGHITSTTPSNLRVLDVLREKSHLCTDELGMYTEWVPTANRDEARIEAIVRRSLEEFLHSELAAEAAEPASQ